MTGRRDFLKGTLWMGAVALASGARCDLAKMGLDGAGVQKDESALSV